MSKNSLVLLGNIVIVVVISVIWAYFRSEAAAQLDVLAKRGLAVIRRENIIFFGIVMPVAVGLISRYVYNRWYAGKPMSFLYLAIAIGIGFSILAAIFYRRALWDFSFLHIVYIIVFGYIMPLMLK